MADQKALVKRFMDEALAQGKVDVIDELVADDYVEHQELPGIEPNKDGLKKFAAMVHDALPDMKVEALKIVEEGDEVWVHSLTSGTHKGEIFGIPATGKKVTWAAIDRVRLKDGKAVEHWGVSDDLGLMTQLGVIPEMG
jgi:predicted ester cyclase